jgi:hypothetical protein
MLNWKLGKCVVSNDIPIGNLSGLQIERSMDYFWNSSKNSVDIFLNISIFKLKLKCEDCQLPHWVLISASLMNIAAVYDLDDAFPFPAGSRRFSFFRNVQIQPLSSVCRDLLSGGGLETDHSPPSGAKVKEVEPNLHSLIHLNGTMHNFLNTGTICCDCTVCTMRFEFFVTLTVESTRFCNDRVAC